MSKAVKLSAVLGLILALIVLPVLASCAKAPQAVAVTPTPAPTSTPQVIVVTPTPGPTPTPAPPKILKFGVTGPLSGSASPWGTGFVQGYTLAAEHINTSGGILVGGQRYVVQVLSYDDHYDIATATANARRLIFQDGVKFMGIFGGAISNAVSPYANQQGVFTSNHSAATKFLGPDKPLAFREAITGMEMSEGFFPWLAKNYPEVKKVAIMDPDDETGWESAAVAKEAALQAGREVVDVVFSSRKTTDFYPILTALLAKKPDLIHADLTPGLQGAAIFAQLYELGYTGIRLADDIPMDALVKAAGVKGAEGVWIMSLFPHFPGPGGKEVEEEYIARWGKPIQGCFYESYVFLLALKDAIEKAGTFDPLTVAKTLEAQPPWDSILGTCVWGGQDIKRIGVKRTLMRPNPLAVIRNGEMEMFALLTYKDGKWAATWQADKLPGK